VREQRGALLRRDALSGTEATSCSRRCGCTQAPLASVMADTRNARWAHRGRNPRARRPAHSNLRGTSHPPPPGPAGGCRVERDAPRLRSGGHRVLRRSPRPAAAPRRRLGPAARPGGRVRAGGGGAGPQALRRRPARALDPRHVADALAVWFPAHRRPARRRARRRPHRAARRHRVPGRPGLARLPLGHRHASCTTRSPTPPRPARRAGRRAQPRPGHVLGGADAAPRRAHARPRRRRRVPGPGAPRRAAVDRAALAEITRRHSAAPPEPVERPLPPVLLPGAAELLAAADSSVALARLRGFTRWVRAGRAVTREGRCSWATPAPSPRRWTSTTSPASAPAPARTCPRSACCCPGPARPGSCAW
jgi:hypothetical protein